MIINKFMRKIFLLCLVCSPLFSTVAQNTFTKDDTLRGSITPQRAWWDLLSYTLDLKVAPETKFISGSNTIVYKKLKESTNLQIDLQEPLIIVKIVQNNSLLKYEKQGKNAYFIETIKNSSEIDSITIFYSGNPVEAKRAPWEGGFSWKKDPSGKHFIATSCQGLGASVWWPCKDHMYDEPQAGMTIKVNVPKGLMNVSNGRLINKIIEIDSSVTTIWKVVNPINNYGVNVNIADYTHFSDNYQGEKGNLSLNYFVLPTNLEKAKSQFKDVNRMLKAFEHWFGPYPFYEDGYKLVEVPYLGMEHQSSVTYGNKYKNGYLGNDLSATGWGLKWDFIIIHESGHEWFANNITYKDVADMWIHESFTNYSENLFTEFYYGKEAGSDYVIGTRANIKNDIPIIGQYDVNSEGSGDMYYKGGNMLHTIRQVINNDELWRKILRGLNSTFYHQTVSTKQIEDYISKESKIDFSKVFDQYLRTTKIPSLEYYTKKKNVYYRYVNTVNDFRMPLKVSIDNKASIFIKPDNSWQKSKGKTLSIDRNFFVNLENKNPR
jgi:aminopeptidase N